MDEDN